MDKKEIENLLEKIKNGIGKSELKIPISQKGKKDIILNRSQYTTLKRLMRMDNIEYEDQKFKKLTIPDTYKIDMEKINLFSGFPPKYWGEILQGYDGKNMNTIRKKIQKTRGKH